MQLSFPPEVSALLQANWHFIMKPLSHRTSCYSNRAIAIIHYLLFALKQEISKVLVSKCHLNKHYDNKFDSEKLI